MGSLITDAATRLADPEHGRWSRAELLSYANYGLSDYARYTGEFRKIAHLTTRQFPERFDLPSDAIEILYVEYDGNILQPTSWRELQSISKTFSTATGTPFAWYQDSTSITELRLYPIPTDNAEDLATFDSEYGAIVDLAISGDTVTFSAEPGEVVRIVDGTGAVTYNPNETLSAAVRGSSKSFGEYGGVVAMEGSKVRLAYIYKPEAVTGEDTEVIVPNHHEEALVFFMLMRAYEKDGVTRDLEKAAYFQRKFEEVVAQAMRTRYMGFAERERQVEGDYF